MTMDLTPSPHPHHLRRDRAVSVDESNGRPSELGPLWKSLTSGAAKVEDAFTRGARTYLVVRRIPEAAARPVAVTSLMMLERTLACDGLKPTSFEFDCSVPTVALHLKRVLTCMGLPCTLSKAPALLILARHAASGMRIDARVAPLDDTVDVVSAARPDLAIEAMLTPGESSVVRRFVEGMSYAEIAGDRARSIRTVANQLSAVFRKLHVSGRLELLRHLAGAARPEERMAMAS